MKNPDRPMLDFWNSDNVRGISNKIFPLVITSTIYQFDVSQILIDGRAPAILCTRNCLKIWVWKEEAYDCMKAQTCNHSTRRPPIRGVRWAKDINRWREGCIERQFTIPLHPLQKRLQLHFGKALHNLLGRHNSLVHQKSSSIIFMENRPSSMSIPKGQK